MPNKSQINAKIFKINKIKLNSNNIKKYHNHTSHQLQLHPRTNIHVSQVLISLGTISEKIIRSGAEGPGIPSLVKAMINH